MTGVTSVDSSPNSYLQWLYVYNQNPTPEDLHLESVLPCIVERRSTLHRAFVDLYLYERVYEFLQRSYFEGRRYQVMERASFISAYGQCQLPIQALVTYYKTNAKDTGIKPHRDRAPFCSVLIALTSDVNDFSCLYVADADGQFQPYPLDAGEMLIFGRRTHYVGAARRCSPRAVIGMFW